MNIAELREHIDRIDAELLLLLERRLKLALRVASAKREQGLPARDEQREHAMLQAARAGATGELAPDEAAEFLQGVLEHSRRWAATRAAGASVKPRRIAIIGLGLIGGSLARALKRTQPAHKLAGVDLPARLDAPRAGGLFELLAAPEDGAAAVDKADVVFLCTPLSRTLELLPQVAEDAPTEATVTDVCGVKRRVTAEAERAFNGPSAPYFVGGHPMAGAAASGYEHGRASLFEGRPWVLTPTPHDPVEKLNTLRGLIESTGARVTLLSAQEHDQAVALVSQLPQLVSSALMLTVAGRDQGIAGPALLGMTRLAASPAALWNELTRELKPELIGELQRMQSYLTELEIAVNFGEPLDKWFNRANVLRRELEEKA
ncbi:MAG: prephenate dehydrogenase/arogenate dehydrogenase family protein [Planctomycetes bacterium]|nr:prephenate dehydrogenase/arogenate dehydrogenase family protein [Planctomycetota bacterium]MCB9934879.1 prephenate dehydrogenase/arogenate dehydrogenase family protein [Planctomycetota bacterium]